MMSDKVEAGTRFNDVGDCEADGYWEWTGDKVVFWTPTKRVRSLSSLDELLDRTRSGHMFLYHVPQAPPSPTDAVIEAARKHVAEWNGHPALNEIMAALTALDAAKGSTP